MVRRSAQRLKLLLVTPALEIGGTEYSTMAIATAMRRRGHEVVWASTGGPLAGRVRKAGLDLRLLPVDGRRPLGILRGVRVLRRAMADLTPDIVHCQELLPAVMCVAGRLGLRPEPRLIWHNRGIRHYCLAAWLFRYAGDLVICNSEYERSLLRRSGLPAGRSVVVHNAFYMDIVADSPDQTDVREELAIPGHARIVLCPCRLVAGKGHRYLLEAFEQVARDEPEAWLLLAGDGPARRQLQAIANGLTARDRVVFAGFRQDMPRLYAEAAAVVFPSLAESFGNVATEALHYGKPLVATDAGGLPEATGEGRYAQLVPRADAGRLAQAISQVLRDPTRAQQRAADGQQWVAGYFTVERMANEIEVIYRELLEGRSGRQTSDTEAAGRSEGRQHARADAHL
ncbi:MAG: glycosyltransferase family 4 protein [Armatimonadota bacterium]